MARTLTINFDKLEETINTYQKAYDDMKQATEDVKNAMNVLRGTKWVSAASSAYFNQYSEDWKVSIDQHLVALQKLKEGLEYTRGEFETVYNNLGNLVNIIRA